MNGLTPLVVLGSFGPALGGVFAIRLTSEGSLFQVNKAGFLIGFIFAAIAAILIAMPDLIGDSEADPRDAVFSQQVQTLGGMTTLVVALVVSGYVFGSVNGPHKTLSAFFAGLRPDRRSLMLAIPVFLLLPFVLLGGHFIAKALGHAPPLPDVLAVSINQWGPLLLINLFTVAMLTGGNEEHGWRGVLQPVLQGWTSPLLASLIVAGFWIIWHLPLHVGEFYAITDPGSAILSRLPNSIMFSIILAAIYHVSKGSIFLCVFFHACINSQLSIFAGNEGPLYPSMIGVLIVLLAIIGFDMWRKRSGYHPEESDPHP